MHGCQYDELHRPMGFSFKKPGAYGADFTRLMYTLIYTDRNSSVAFAR